jgi:DNA-binding transcriptional LysR family regulator
LLPTGELSRLPEVEWLSSQDGARVVFRSNSMLALMDAASAGKGLVPLPLGWGDSEKALVRAKVLEHIPERKVWVVTHPISSERFAVGVVVNHLVAIFERIFGT